MRLTPHVQTTCGVRHRTLFTAALLQPKHMKITRHDTGAVYLLLRERGDRTKLSSLRELFFGAHLIVMPIYQCNRFGCSSAAGVLMRESSSLSSWSGDCAW
jgi:hypothetical protein